MIRILVLVLLSACSLAAFAKNDTLSRQALIDRYTVSGFNYIDSLTDVYLNGSKVEKLNAAMPLWCAFNKNSWMEKESFAPISKIDPAALSAFIKAAIKKEDQTEKRIEFWLLTKPCAWLEKKVNIGSLDTNQFTVSQKAVYHYIIGRDHYRGSTGETEKQVHSFNKAVHYSKKNSQLDFISLHASHYLGGLYFNRGAIEKALFAFEDSYNIKLNFDNGKVHYLKGLILYQNERQHSVAIMINLGMCYEKMGKLSEGINYYERALNELTLARWPNESTEFWAKALMVNSYFDLNNSHRANKLLANYLTELNKIDRLSSRKSHLHGLFRELNYYDIQKSAEILDSLFFSNPANNQLIKAEAGANKPTYLTYLERANNISILAMVRSFGGKKLPVPRTIADIGKLIELHNSNIEASNANNMVLKSLQCIELAWKMASQNKKDAAISQNRLKALFANEDSLHYFAYNAKLTTYILKLNGQHAQEIELLELLMPRYKKGNYVLELQKLYFQLSEAYEATGNPSKSLAYYKRSDSLKQQTQQINQQAQLAMFDKKLEVSKTNTEKKLLETENETLKARRNWLILLVVSAGVVVCLLGLLFRAKRKRHKLLVSQKQMELQLLETDVSNKNTQLENTTLQLLKSNSSSGKLVDEMNRLSTNLNPENKKKARTALLDHKTLGKDDVWEQFKLQFQKTNPSFFTRLKAHNENLTEGELRICAMHVSKLHSKEMSAITGQQIRSIYTLKSRIRKKLGVQDDEEMLETLRNLTLE